MPHSIPFPDLPSVTTPTNILRFGTGWRDAGSLSHKQNVFDDFVACAEELVAQRYCSPASLVIQVL